ncbi:MAG: hotdog fold thioesterase [bacterium]|nr:hotdog fold thioesterase [bacterium]
MNASSSHRTYLPTSAPCFVCGEDNHAGLQTRFYVEDGVVKATLSPEPHHCGYDNVVHGGVVAAILDETMGWTAARAITRMCMTGELTVRYLKRVPADRELTVVTELVKASKRMAQTKGALVDSDGEVYARAEARFLPLSVEETLHVDDNLIYRGGEERVFDELREESEG